MLKKDVVLKMLLSITLLLAGLLPIACDSDSDDPPVDGDQEAGEQEQPDGDTDGDLDGDAELPPIDGDGEEEAEQIEYPWDDDTLGVMSFNVMCSFCSNDDKTNEPWDARVPHFGDIIARYAPDLIGLQELTYASEIEEIQAVAPGYAAAFASDLSANELGWTDYPDAAILYRADRFTLVESGHYWNSATPDVPWAGGWQSGSGFWRIVVWVKLKQVSDGREFYFANTHFDNNTPNQENSAPLALQRFEPFAQDHPVVFVGDFNSKPDSEAYGILTGGVDGAGFHFVNAFDIADGWAAIHNQNSAPAYDADSRIDHIFLAGTADWACPVWNVDQTVYGETDQYPSDHFPIFSELSW